MITLQHCKSAIAIAALFAAGGSFAATMNNADYKAAKDRISADYKTDKAACDGFNGNAKDICVEQAKGKENVARAELEASYSGKAADFSKVAVVKADSAYAVAKEMCDDKGGNAKDVCVSEAKATHTKELTDAKLNKKVGLLNKQAREAKNDAVQEKREAEYKVAIEKCDALAGGAKESCVSAAKSQFDKS